jgi:hypothetical protein
VLKGLKIRGRAGGLKCQQWLGRLKEKDAEILQNPAEDCGWSGADVKLGFEITSIE